MVIDPHVHVLKAENFDEATLESLGYSPGPKDTPIERLVDWLREADVEKAVIMGQDMTRIWNSSCGEEYVLECARRYPDFFVALASVEPVDASGRFNRTALDYFEKSVREYDFKGVLFTPPYGRFHSDDPAVYPFYEKAVELSAIVQFHHCAHPGLVALAPFEYANPVSLSNILVDFPNLKVVVEHLNHPWYEELFFLMAANPNVYADVAMTYDRPYILTWNLVKAKEFKVIDRVMYASDYWVAGFAPFSEDAGGDMKRWIDFIKTGLNEIAEKCQWPIFTQGEIDGILYKNAARLYGFI